jgi:hypothetical protein
MVRTTKERVMNAKRRMAVIIGVMLVVGPSAWKSGALVAQETPKTDARSAAPSVAGSWTMSIESPEAMSASLTLKQDGQHVTGTFSSDHTGEAALAGEFVDGTLTFSITADAGHGPMQIGFRAKLKDDGTLTGTLTGPMGEMSWTAERVKAK